MKHKIFDDLRGDESIPEFKITLPFDKPKNARNYEPDSEIEESLQMNDLLLLIVKESQKDKKTEQLD